MAQTSQTASSLHLPDPDDNLTNEGSKSTIDPEKLEQLDVPTEVMQGQGEETGEKQATSGTELESVPNGTADSEDKVKETSKGTSRQDSAEEEYEESNAEEEEKKVVPIFICHEIDPGVNKYLPSRQLAGKSTKGGMKADDQDEAMEDDEFIPLSKKGKRYQRAYPDELDYRPAAMAPFPTIIKQTTAQTHALLCHYGCQRLAIDKLKAKLEGVKTEEVREGMERKLNRLKIYRRAFSSLVIYFRAYSPILFYTKKSYDDMITYRLRQFREAQHEKVKIHHEKVLMKEKMQQYRFPDYNRLLKSREYLNLLLTRIQKQDEAIKFITDILSKMERALSEHYEQGRDLEDQIKLLDSEIADRRQKAMYPKKKFMDIPDEENKEVTAEIDRTTENLSDSEEDLINENEEMDEDKRMVLILAYAVCLKDLEDAEKKLRIYETKYQNIAPRHELETMKRKIQDEKAQISVLQNERDTLEEELVDLREQDVLVDEELEDLMEMTDDDKLNSIKQKFAREKGLNKDDENESLEDMEHGSEDDLEEDLAEEFEEA